MHDPIPWHVFFQAMREQSPQSLERWLSRWRFGDSAVVLRFNLQDSEMRAKAKLEQSVIEFIAQRAKHGGKLH